MTIEVATGGQVQQKFSVHEGLLRHNSLWFANRMNGNRGNSNHINIEDDANMFNIFVEFVYRNKILGSIKASSNPSRGSNGAVKKQKLETRENYDTETLAKLYIFAEMRQCEQLKCATVNEFHSHHAYRVDHLPCKAVEIIYDGTPEGNIMRKFLVDSFVIAIPGRAPVDLKDDMATYFKENFPRDFLAELLVALYKSRELRKPPKQREYMVAADYHGHDNS